MWIIGAYTVTASKQLPGGILGSMGKYLKMKKLARLVRDNTNLNLPNLQPSAEKEVVMKAYAEERKLKIFSKRGSAEANRILGSTRSKKHDYIVQDRVTFPKNAPTKVVDTLELSDNGADLLDYRFQLFKDWANENKNLSSMIAIYLFGFISAIASVVAIIIAR